MLLKNGTRSDIIFESSSVCPQTLRETLKKKASSDNGGLHPSHIYVARPHGARTSVHASLLRTVSWPFRAISHPFQPNSTLRRTAHPSPVAAPTSWPACANQLGNLHHIGWLGQRSAAISWNRLPLPLPTPPKLPSCSTRARRPPSDCFQQKTPTSWATISTGCCTCSCASRSGTSRSKSWRCSI